MSLAVLSEAQMRAVEYVMEISKKESESVYTQLRDRVVGLGYTEHDLERLVYAMLCCIDILSLSLSLFLSLSLSFPLSLCNIGPFSGSDEMPL